MATEKQVKAVENMVENGGVVSRAMEDAGYSPNTAKTPKKLTESKGFKEVCDERGLTDDLIIGSLVEDIIAKPQNRKPELELGAKIKGMLVDKMEHSGSLIVKQTNYGERDNNSVQLPAEELPITPIESDGRGDEESGNSVAS